MKIRWPLIPALVLLLLGLFLIGQPAQADAPPPRPEQPRPDLFSCGIGTCDLYNPVTIKAKQTRSIAYRVVVESGCSAGVIPQELERMNNHIMSVDGIDFVIAINNSRYDFTVHINCGNEQIRLCGSINTYCLGRGYPYNADVDISDVLSTYYPESRLSILLHEILGHAIASWNEQYARCAASCNFQPSPGWRDIMNTGPDSRHGIETIELERLHRTMPELFPPLCFGDPCWNGSRWVFANGWSVDVKGNDNPNDDLWYDPLGRLYWTGVEPWGGRCTPVKELCDWQGDGFYDWSLGDPWVVVP